MRHRATRELCAEPAEEPDICKNECRTPGSESLPKGIVQDKYNFEMETMGCYPEWKDAGRQRPSKSLLGIPVGINQKTAVDKLISKDTDHVHSIKKQDAGHVQW